MFSTDVAARGLDFPAVDWVIQMDCPEDGVTYVHRLVIKGNCKGFEVAPIIIHHVKRQFFVNMKY